jgi:hypothetical protein
MGLSANLVDRATFRSSSTVVEQIRRCRSRGKVGGRSGYGCFGDYGDHSSSVVRDGWREHDRRAERSCPQGQVHLRFGHKRVV